jgi:hypothetical protein
MNPISETITYRSEGSYDPKSRFYALIPHQPTLSSGVTIGLGYDLGFRKAPQVSSMFRQAGIPWEVTQQYLPAVGLRGVSARNFLSQKQPPSLTEAQADRLFTLAYGEAATDVQRICSKEDVVNTYGATNWQALDPRIKELLVDLRYRGDYTPLSRKLIQRAVVLNDLPSLRRIMQNRNLWPHVPISRFLARQEILRR